jgi:hypothetical protein
MSYPKWFDWLEWNSAIGSDTRYIPRWYERRAYVMGLRDAARIAENHAWQSVAAPKPGSNTVEKAPGFTNIRMAIAAIHTYTIRYMQARYHD